MFLHNVPFRQSCAIFVKHIFFCVKLDWLLWHYSRINRKHTYRKIHIPCQQRSTFMLAVPQCVSLLRIIQIWLKLGVCVCLCALHAKSVLTHTKDMFFKRYRMVDFCVNLFAKVPFFFPNPVDGSRCPGKGAVLIIFQYGDSVPVVFHYADLQWTDIDFICFEKCLYLLRWAVVGVTLQMEFQQRYSV